MESQHVFSDTADRIISLGPAITYICQPTHSFPPVYISPNIQTLLGYTPQQFTSEPDFWLSRIHPDDKDQTLNKLSKLNENDHHLLEYRFQHKDGTYRWMRDRLNLIRNDQGEPLELIGYWCDISEQREIERELIKAKEEAEKASEAKSQFLSRVSHELRTPLNAILGYAQLIELDDDNLSEQQNKNITQILNGGWHLLDMVKDLLDLSAIQTNKLELNPAAVNICGRVQDCIDLIQPLAQQRDISITGALNECIGKHVQADPIRLKQVLHNLMSNAVKYNRPGGRISLRCEETKGGIIRVSVTDNGSGIPEEDLPTLFEPFNRLYLNTYAIEGSGIGLTIAKHLVERMNGKIGVTSILGSGSTFWVELPVCQPNTAKNITETDFCNQSTDSNTKEALMIYVEDSPSHVQLMEDVISTIPGVRLISASTPKLGLELIQTHKPDIITLDICLPGMSGMELLEKLLADPATRETPVIALSASAMPKDVEAGLRAGFRRYLTKPIKITEFTRAVEELLQDQISRTY